MAFRRSARNRQINEVNMTPLMDLTFLLLITFMITFPLIEQGIPLKLPQGKAKELDDSAKASVSVDANGKVYVDELEVELDMVGPMLKERLAAQPELTVLVRADEGLAYGKVVAVLRELHAAEVTRRVRVRGQGGQGLGAKVSRVWVKTLTVPASDLDPSRNGAATRSVRSWSLRVEAPEVEVVIYKGFVGSVPDCSSLPCKSDVAIILISVIPFVPAFTLSLSVAGFRQSPVS